MSKICLVVDFTIKPGAKAQFLEIIGEHASKTLENEEGCIQFEVCDPVEGGNRVFLYEMYADDAAFEVHKGSPTLARTRERYADIVRVARHPRLQRPLSLPRSGNLPRRSRKKVHVQGRCVRRPCDGS